MFFVDFEGFGLGLGEAFAVDLGLPPKGCIGSGGKGWGETPADGRVEGVRVKVRNGFASFPPLWVEVCTSPDDVVEVAVEDAAVITYCVEVVVEFCKFNLIVSAAASGNVEVADLFTVQTFGCCLRGAVVDLPEATGKGFET